jgi:hypothetical protein
MPLQYNYQTNIGRGKRTFSNEFVLRPVDPTADHHSGYGSNDPSPRRFQRGYLLEIPIILFVLVIVLSLLMPHLSLIGQKIVLGIAVIPFVFCLFYMIVAPGWVPGTDRRGLSVWRLVLFLGCAAAIVTGVGAFILR